ncbi:MAG: helix-turn-helix transcriptional regulator [Lachnospiraceae bacterium]|nr:helix-turn-helix transcriptional regulator [Lachnospiraceae bacterium]
MEDIKSVIAKNIYTLRTANKMTQLEMAERLNYSDKAVSKWERAEGLPDIVVIKQIADMFGVTVDYLMSTEEERAAKGFVQEKQVVEQGPRKYTPAHRLITVISLIGIWTISLGLFFIFWTQELFVWQVFIYTLPVFFITWLVFNSTWGNRRNNLYIVSALVWSILLVLYVALLKYNVWMIFLLGIPAQIIVYLSFRINRVRKRA